MNIALMMAVTVWTSVSSLLGCMQCSTCKCGCDSLNLTVCVFRFRVSRASRSTTFVSWEVPDSLVCWAGCSAEELEGSRCKRNAWCDGRDDNDVIATVCLSACLCRCLFDKRWVPCPAHPDLWTNISTARPCPPSKLWSCFA